MAGARSREEQLTFASLPSRGLTIRFKLLFFTAAICSFILVALTTTAFFLSAVSLRTTRLEGFRSLRRSLAETINTAIDTARRSIATQAEMQTCRYAISELAAGYEHLLDDLAAGGFRVDQAFFDQIRTELNEAYRNHLLAALSLPGGEAPDYGTFADVSREGLVLQYVYFLKNPASIDHKYLNNTSDEIAANTALAPTFRSAFAKTMFARAMDRYHESFQSVVQRNRYDDLLLVDDLGNVIYSFKKSWDFGTNVFKGWQNQASLKRIFLGAWYVPLTEANRGSTNHVVVSDLAKYPAAYNAAMMFFGAPITNRLGSRMGVLVHEISSVSFTDLVTFDRHWQQVGLGRSGEAYIVGADRRLRTESRFADRLPARYRAETYTPDGLRSFQTSLLTAPLSNAAVENIFSGNNPNNEGEVTFYDELGHESLGVYAPLPIPELNWGLVIRIDTGEAFAPAARLTRLIACGGAAILVLAIGSTLVFAQILSHPIAQLVATAEKIGAGDLSARTPISSTDEIGFLAERFNHMIDQIEDHGRQMRKIFETVNEGLFLLDRKLTIQPGYSHATEEIFHRKIVGLNFLDLIRPVPGQWSWAVLSTDELAAAESYLELLLNPRVKEKLIRQTNPLNEVEFHFCDKGGRPRTKFLEFCFNRVLEAGQISQIMVTVVDATSRISLGRQIRENQVNARLEVEMLFGILHVDSAILSDFLEDTDREIREVLQNLEAEQHARPSAESLSEREQRYGRLLQRIGRSIHVIKGNAAMLRLSYFETLAHQLENKIGAARQNPQLVGEHFVPITTALASLLDQVKMTRDLIERLVSMQGVFGRNQGSGKDGDFGALANLAVDVAARNGKQVCVKLDVEPALLTLPDRLRRPVQSVLAQLVRNAIIHGIELPAERVARDKPPAGSIVITGRRKGPKLLLFSVRDDGSGLNFPALRQRAVELKMLPPDAPDTLNREQAIDILCASGFTTLLEPSPDGGRGVGLDAVNDLLCWLGGRIDVETKPGQYTRFMVELPV
ncbi:MAG: HAMP domain-containing protein [Verrucomicrobia bacterium]|nr:HAMP domain-containing protein [Verrucomicrobiota bacterium]